MQSLLLPKHFAELLRKTNELREASWVDDPGKYNIDLDKAAELACEQLGFDKSWGRIVEVTIFPGYCDVWEWCDEVCK